MVEDSVTSIIMLHNQGPHTCNKHHATPTQMVTPAAGVILALSQDTHTGLLNSLNSQASWYIARNRCTATVTFEYNMPNLVDKENANFRVSKIEKSCWPHSNLLVHDNFQRWSCRCDWSSDATYTVGTFIEEFSVVRSRSRLVGV